MPEGDTVFRAAGTLRRALGGQRVIGFASAVGSVALRAAGTPLPGRLIAAVEARGKHLVMVFRVAGDDGEAAPVASALGMALWASDLVLHTHMGMTGSWHLYRRGERWQKPEWRARVAVRVADFVAPCFSPLVVELLTPREVARHRQLSSLGPDALARDFDPAPARSRILRSPGEEIGVALVDQGALAGVGNVYKSEALFLARVSPFARAGELAPDVLDRLLGESHRLLWLNREGPARRTRSGLDPSERLWVYGRSGRPCRVCGEPIRMRRQGAAARSTYFCPRCQGPVPLRQ